MTRRPRLEFPGALYHVTTRRNDRGDLLTLVSALEQNLDRDPTSQAEIAATVDSFRSAESGYLDVVKRGGGWEE